MGVRSHPHPDSCLVAHSRSVAAYMRAALQTNIREEHLPSVNFIADVSGYLHDILKDTPAFQNHLDGGQSSSLSRHSGGGAVIGYWVARSILTKNGSLLSASPLRPLFPHIVFAVIAAHHGRIKLVNITKEHFDALEHWHGNFSSASMELFECVEERCGVSVEIEEICHLLEETLERRSWTMDKPIAQCDASLYFDALMLTKLCLGALAQGDAESAARQSMGCPEPDAPSVKRVAAVFHVPPFESGSSTPLNRLRTKFQNDGCSEIPPQGQALLLRAPTGLGKTIAVSKLISLLQEVRGPSRVFYLAPTVTILDQIAKEIFPFNRNSDNMLFHYLVRQAECDTEEKLSSEQIRNRLKRFAHLDAGLVVTTYHRVIGILAGCRKNQCPSFTGLRESIWVFDECQFLSYLQFPLFSSLCSSLIRLCGAMPVFMSATPQSPRLWNSAHSSLGWNGFEGMHSLLTDEALYALEDNPLVDGRRLIHPLPEISGIDALAMRVNEFKLKHPEKSILILVNLAIDAVNLWRKLGTDSVVVTNYLRPIDIRKKLGNVHRRLKNGEPVLMVATSIVQAGVDLDFDIGFVELNDLRTFRQGCGRVGRGFFPERGACPVYAFELKNDNEVSSWFRQRFGSMLRDSEVDLIQDAYREIVEKGVEAVLSSGDGLRDSDIAILERGNEPEVEAIFRTVAGKLKGFPPDYDHLLFHSTPKQGFSFECVESLLIDDLRNEEVSPFLVVFMPDDEDVRNEFFEKTNVLEGLGERILQRDADNWDDLSAYRILKRDIMQLTAPYSLRRQDVQRSFFKNGMSKGFLYEEFDFCLLLHPEQYDAKSIGWDTEWKGIPDDQGCVI